MPESASLVEPIQASVVNVGTAVGPGPNKPTPRGGVSRTGRRTYFWFLAPCIVFLAVLSLAPLLLTLLLSTQELVLSRSSTPSFVGVDNYSRLFSDQIFWNAVRISIFFLTVPVLVQTVLGVSLALILNSEIPIIRRSRPLFIAPMVIAPVVAGLIWMVLFAPNLGGINYLLGQVGLPTPAWLDGQYSALAAVGIVTVWQDTPFITLLVLAGLEGVPTSHLEAAKVEGASFFQLFRYVLLPYVKPVLFVAITFRVINSLAVFPIIFVLTGGGPGRATEVLNFYAYVTSFRHLDLGYGATLAVALIVLMVTLTAALVIIRQRQLDADGE